MTLDVQAYCDLNTEVGILVEVEYGEELTLKLPRSIQLGLDLTLRDREYLQNKH
jgi:hypothetical protein